MHDQFVGKEIEPNVGVRELDAFFHDFRQTVLELENAYREDSLADRMLEVDVEARFGTMIRRAYQQLVDAPHQNDPANRRIETVRALLDETRDELFEIDQWFHATIADSEMPAETYRVTRADGDPVLLRHDQLLASRFWRIGFVFDDQSSTDRLVADIANEAIRHFARDLRDLASLIPRISRGDADRYPRLVPPRSGRAFEQLIADILNENGKHARLSRLSEDYSQKTDIRVKYPDLGRKRGARVQVTRTASRSGHEKKIAGIRGAEQYVVVSPWSIASAVPGFDSGDGHSELLRKDPELISRFWSCVPGQPSDVEKLSFQLRSMLESAIKASSGDPRGPLASVPAPLREFIRVWVRADAFRSTRSLRDREASDGKYVVRPDGRMAPRKTSPVAIRFLERHPTNQIVRAMVSEIERKSTWVHLEDGLRGRVQAHEVSWAHDRADASRFLTPGQYAHFVVQRINASYTPAIIELSLKRTEPDPWLGDLVETLAKCDRINGRVWGHAKFGLFVEIAPQLVGLLHHSMLPGESKGSLKTRFPLDSEIVVTVVDFSRESRRIALKPTTSEERADS